MSRLELCERQVYDEDEVMRGMQAFARCPQRADAPSMSLLPSYVYMRGLEQDITADRRQSNVMQCVICMIRCRLLITSCVLQSACYGTKQMLEEPAQVLQFRR